MIFLKHLGRLRLLRGIAAAMIALTLFAGGRPASADVSTLVLGSRTCATITAYVLYDSFSEGTPPFYAAFSADLNGNGVFGEAGEPTSYVLVGPGGTAGYIKGVLTFPAVPAGTTIAVTAYEVDSNGTIVSAQLPAVRYTCTHRPATNLYPPNTGLAIPGVGITIKITANPVTVYDAPSNTGNAINGLASGTILNVIGRNQHGDWLQVQLGSSTGWIMWVTNGILFGPYRQLPVVG